ncbi:MAG: hypothetical protein DRG30_02675 [Epsilonproteobacteria bacterium]|nr:MAG: hypothetical protein DRG30_02675 [Campylobacterota bacterium]
MGCTPTILETKNNALQNCDNIKAYIIGKTKGVHLSGENTFPEINIDSLFKDEEVNINLNEIEKHINIIKDSIKSI